MALVVEKTTRKIAFMEGKPVRNTFRKVHYQNIGFDELVEEIAQTQGITKTVAKAVVEAYINRLCHYMQLGMGVQMGDFGIFKPCIRTKTANSADELDSSCVKKHIQFVPGKSFKQMLKNLKVVTLTDAEEVDSPEQQNNQQSQTNDDNSNGHSDGFD